MDLVVYTDGASQGNPGRAGAAAVLKGPDGATLRTAQVTLPHATNNEAEYMGVLEGLRLALGYGATRLTLRSDSELLIRQLLGTYEVRAANLLPLHEEAKGLASQLDFVAFEHVPRAYNAEADRLAKDAALGKR